MRLLLMKKNSQLHSRRVALNGDILYALIMPAVMLLNCKSIRMLTYGNPHMSNGKNQIEKERPKQKQKHLKRKRLIRE